MAMRRVYPLHILHGNICVLTQAYFLLTAIQIIPGTGDLLCPMQGHTQLLQIVPVPSRDISWVLQFPVAESLFSIELWAVQGKKGQPVRCPQLEKRELAKKCPALIQWPMSDPQGWLFLG